MYLVCWVDTNKGKWLENKYEVFIDSTSEENLTNAKKKYEEIIEDEDTYSANLCKIVQSTDY
jgi:hypothetical protein